MRAGAQSLSGTIEVETKQLALLVPVDGDRTAQPIEDHLQPENINDRQAIGDALAEFAEHQAYRGHAVTRDEVPSGSGHDVDKDTAPSQITGRESEMTARKRKTADTVKNETDNEAVDAAARINGKFAPGHSGNPRGRPRETPEEFALLSKIRSLSDKAVKALESVFDNPDAPADAKIKAANIVIERQLGKPRQEIDQNVTQNIATPADFKPDLYDLRWKAMGVTQPSPDTPQAAEGEEQPPVLQH
jgi:hypothetical protein